jgi:hypothetical protein
MTVRNRFGRTHSSGQVSRQRRWVRTRRGGAARGQWFKVTWDDRDGSVGD